MSIVVQGRAVRKRDLITSTVTIFFASVAFGNPGSWQEFAVWPLTDDQQAPDIYGNIVVWDQFVNEYGDYDIYIADITLAEPLVLIIGDANDQMNPAIYENTVVWQDYIIWEDSGDWDIWGADINNQADPTIFAVSDIAYNGEQIPAIHGNTVVWQDGDAGDFHIYAADITDSESPMEFLIAGYDFDQQAPAIYRTTVVWQDDGFVNDDDVREEDVFAADIWLRNKPAEFSVSSFEKDQQNPAICANIIVWQDNYFGDWDIYAADISEPISPIEFAITKDTSSQVNPDIDGNIVVWQDDRQGDWDIYGYNLTTQQEFRITDNSADQINPAISGNIVVWQDNRSGNWNIYAAVLGGAEVAECAAETAGDVNGDCKTDFTDFAVMAFDWLGCNLEPEDACRQ